jgi:FAD/FMN-containing dehydrogenase
MTFSIEELRTGVKGEVIAPGDDGYDESRATYYGVDRRPAAVVRPADSPDVSVVVTMARETGTELGVRGGGHSLAGLGVSEGGVNLDLSSLVGLDIDVDDRSAWAGAGLTAAEYTTRVGAHGLATGFGDAGTVGLGGITLGGGVGFLSRKHGLTIDSLLAAEMVTADGEILEVHPTSHPDLFWAIRGGGGNFGVATRFKLRLHDVSEAFGGMLILPGTPDVINGFVQAAEAAPEELSTIANVMPAPPMPFLPEDQHGQIVVFAILVHAGDSASGERAVAPFRGLATPLADMVGPMEYPSIYQMMGEEEGPEEVQFAVRSLYSDSFDETAAKTVVSQLEISDAMMAVTQIRVLGGAIARIQDDATAYAHRQRRIMLNVACMYQDPAEAPSRQAWTDDLAAALGGGDEAYVNFLGDEGPDRVRAAYPGATWDRLREIKRRYDPTNLFRLNQNIPPAG